LFERPKLGERAVLVQVSVGERVSEEQAHEFQELALSAGADIRGSVSGSRVSPNPRFFIGSGKVAQVKALVEEQQVDLVLFDHDLSPSQERNLEKELRCRVLDRSGLILDIFAQRARSFEGKLQVELAQLEHLSTRLVRGWTHLERQKGGIGLRGPGETQLETDRRLLAQRIKQLNRRLERVRHQREQGRRLLLDIPTRVNRRCSIY
jgi:GTP-binding protein HflX